MRTKATRFGYFLAKAVTSCTTALQTLIRIVFGKVCLSPVVTPSPLAHAHLKSLGASPRVHPKHVFKWWHYSHIKVSDKRRDACRVPVDLWLLMCALQHPFVVWFPGLQLRVLCSTYAL